MKSIKLKFSILLFAAFLTGCSEATQSISDSMHETGESMQATADDISIRQQIGQALARDPAFINSHISVTSFNAAVLLVGQTSSETLKERAEAIAHNIRYVRRVYNFITISGITSALTRSSDAWITTKVKTDIIARTDLPSSRIKVVTENGDVFLMGLITRKQAKLAAAVARRVSGVQRVIKLFEYKN